MFIYQVMMNYRYFITPALVDIAAKIFQRGCRVARICVLQKPCRIIRKTWKKLGISHPLFEDNYMNLSAGKCHLLISSHKHEHQLVQIGKDMVWEENKVKLLGATIDNELIFDSHIWNICSKANKKLSLLCKLKNISAAEDTLSVVFWSAV